MNIPHPLSRVKDLLKRTPWNYIFCSTLKSLKFISGNFTDVGSVFETIMTDGRVLIGTIIEVREDGSKYEFDMFSNDKSIVPYRSIVSLEDVTSDNTTIVHFETIFKDEPSESLLKFREHCNMERLMDLQRILGNSLLYQRESIVIKAPVDTVWDTLKTNWLKVMKSTLKNVILDPEGAFDKVGSGYSLEYNNGEKMKFKITEISDSDFSLRFQFLNTDDKVTTKEGFNIPKSMELLFRLTRLASEDSTLLEHETNFSGDVKSSFVNKRKEISRSQIMDIHRFFTPSK